MQELLNRFPKALQQGSIEPFMHKGEWAIHEVLPILIDAIGPCAIKIATFSISEDSLRPIFFLADEGKITSLELLLDTTVKRHKLDLLLFAANITQKIRIDSCHAKVLLVENDDYSFGIVGSANLNQNHRWEAGFYFTQGDHFNYFKEEFNNSYQNAMNYALI
ncbi:MAG: phospholipase D family protein [Phocaeicola sp.]